MGLQIGRATDEKIQHKCREISAGYCMAGVTLCHAGQARQTLATKKTQRQADKVSQAAPSVL